MTKVRKILSYLLILLMGISLLPASNVQAFVNDVSIISTTKLTVEEAKTWARSKGATDTFINLAELFWKYSSSNGGVNPAVAYAQSALETGYGKFGGVIDETYHNTCGMKTPKASGIESDNNKDEHYRFNNWDEGVQAHLDHLALYAGANGYPRSNTYDPRHFSWIIGKATTVLSLEGNWATSSGYGQKVLTLYKDLMSYHKLSPIGSVDYPSDGRTISGNRLTVSGWALNDSGIKEVKVYIDNVYKGTATYGLLRSDVGSIYSAYKDANKSGYNITIDISYLTPGDKQIKVEQIGKDGTVNIITKKVKYSKVESIISIDSPREYISSDQITISGWAVSLKDIKEVNVYLDGVNKGKLSYGVGRLDVAKIYPNYANSATSGFTGTIDVSNVSTGTKRMKVELITEGGGKYYSEKLVKVTRPSARINIDSPINNGTYNSNNLNVSGWALSRNGTKEIKVYLDENLIGTTKTGISRPDVANAYPEYNDRNSGFNINIDVGNLTTGKKTLRVEQISQDGTRSSSQKSIAITRPSPRTNIDTPSTNEVIRTNSLTVGGWALNSKGVNKINVYIDGTLMGTTTTGISRLDVANAYPEYNDKNSGFNISIDINNLSSGKKILKVEQVSKDGTKSSSEKTITITKPSPRVNIDTPSINEIIKTKSLTVGGWALSHKGVSKVNVYINGTLMGTTNTGILRQDVANAYPEYNDKNSGFNISIDINNLSAGKKILKVEQVSKDGTKSTSEKSITITKPSPQTNIDKPTRNETVISNSLLVSGWALNFSGVKKVNIYIDGTLMGTTTTNISRPDVAAIYPEYGINNSGYSMSIDLSKISAGVKNLKVEQVGNDGSKSYTEKNINIDKLEPKLVMDTPKANEIVKVGDNLKVSGWALNKSGIKEVRVYVDNVLKSNATININREDVAKAYPLYPNGGTSGYSALFSTSGISVGTHEVKVIAVGNDGSTCTTTRKFRYGRDVLIVIDPGHNYGGDYGAVAVHNGTTYSETELNMKFATQVKNYLEDEGYSVILTRKVGEMSKESLSLSLANKVKVANNNNADLFISIHQNSFTSASPNGVEVFSTETSPDKGYSWTNRDIKLTISKKLALDTVNNIASSTGFYNRGAKVGNFFVLRNTKMPAILVECGFISNPSNAVSLATEATQKNVAKSITKSVLKFFN